MALPRHTLRSMAAGAGVALALAGGVTWSARDAPAAAGAAHRPALIARAAGTDSVPMAGYARALDDLARHYWQGTGPMPHLRPTQGDGGPANGLVVDWPVPTYWQMAQYAALLYGRWRIDHDADAGARLTANWRFLRSIASPAELGGDGRSDRSINISDDAAWKANYLAQTHEVTGDPAALAALTEMIPATLERFAMPGPRTTFGRSPGGRTLAAGPAGIFYAAAADGQARRTYGSGSSLYEAGLANAALYAFGVTADRAYRDYAVATWRWIHDDLRSIKENDADAATGLYLTDLDVAPGRPIAARNRYWGKPIRGLAAEYGGGTLGMAVLSARLYRTTGEARYLDEARAIIAAFPRPDAFGRVRSGRTLLVNARDPWTEGFWYPATVSEVLTLPGVDPDHAFARALVATARAILAARTPDGYYGADWSGPELNVVDGTRSWAETSRRANGGKGGGQATPEQIMTSASSILVVQAAAALRR